MVVYIVLLCIVLFIVVLMVSYILGMCSCVCELLYCVELVVVV